MDISAAFDTVPHFLLLHKLKAYGVRGGLHNLISSYLSDRTVHVNVNGSKSDLILPRHFINSGVPQGAILGPLLFLLYINDIPDNLQSNVFLYADDTCLLAPIDPNRPGRGNRILQSDLIKLAEWSATWGLTFKPSKSRDLLFSSRKPIIYPPLIMEGNPIPQVETHKHLGFVLDSNLSYSAHVEHLAHKVQTFINPLKFLSRTLKSRHLDLIYRSFISPHFDYGDILYDSASKGKLATLDKTQYTA